MKRQKQAYRSRRRQENQRACSGVAKSCGLSIARNCCLAAFRRMSKVITRSSRRHSTGTFSQLKVGGDKRLDLQTWRMKNFPTKEMLVPNDHPLWQDFILETTIYQLCKFQTGFVQARSSFYKSDLLCAKSLVSRDPTQIPKDKTKNALLELNVTTRPLMHACTCPILVESFTSNLSLD